jgi:hypothetical protein
MNEGILSSIFDDIENMSNIPQDEFKTCLESIESDLAELDSIDQSIEEAEKASFESIIEDINLFNSVLAYKNAKSGVTLESVSSEFDVSMEALKEAMNKGLATIKALSKKSTSVIMKFKNNLNSNRKLLRNVYSNAKYLDKNTKYDIREFALTLMWEIQLAAIFSNTVHRSDFPSDPALKPALDYAFGKVKEFYSDSSRESAAQIMTMITGIEGDVNIIVKNNDSWKISNSITAPDDFDYHANAIELINAFKRYNLEDEINHVIDKSITALDKINKTDKVSDEEKKDMVRVAKEVVSALNSIKDVYHITVKGLVRTCNGHKKIDK